MPTDGQQNRVFLRIPVRISADAYQDGQFFKKSRLMDLSTNGLSFLVGPSDLLPDHFEIRFKLTPFSRVIKIMLQVKNRVPVPGGVRAGCLFADISDVDRASIDRYVCHFSGISLQEQVINLAAFLCVVDAAARLLLYYLNDYYSATDFGRMVVEPGAAGLSAAALVMYAFSSCLAFVFSCPSMTRKGSSYFVSSVLLLGNSFVFLMVKNFSLWQDGFWGMGDPGLTRILVVQLLLVGYLAMAIVVGVLSLKKVALVLGVVKQEFSVLKLGFEHLNFLRKGR
jgi:hypothetical protein